jgi:hypothetical protein
MLDRSGATYSDFLLSGGGMRSQYDWCGPGRDTPEKSPRSFSTYYLWRSNSCEKTPFGYIEGAIPLSTAAMRQQNHAIAADALRGFSDFGTRPSGNIQQKCQRAIDVFYGEGVYECVAYAMSCNVSSGFPVGLFWVREAQVG